MPVISENAYVIDSRSCTRPLDRQLVAKQQHASHIEFLWILLVGAAERSQQFWSLVLEFDGIRINLLPHLTVALHRALIHVGKRRILNRCFVVLALWVFVEPPKIFLSSNEIGATDSPIRSFGKSVLLEIDRFTTKRNLINNDLKNRLPAKLLNLYRRINRCVERALALCGEIKLRLVGIVNTIDDIFWAIRIFRLCDANHNYTPTKSRLVGEGAYSFKNRP